MDRRAYLRAAGAVGAVGLPGLSGCLGFELQSGGSGGEGNGLVIPAVPADRPDAVYYPSHVEEVAMVDTGSGGDYEVGLMYSYAHRFWNVNGEDVERTDPVGDVHLMASVWDAETRQVLPETGLSLEIAKGGELVSQEVIYPMLSQPMGFHYGANFGLDGDGTYDVTLEVGGVNTRRTGAFETRFGDPADVTVEFEYRQSERDELGLEVLDDAGDPGAVDPHEMEMMPDSYAPETGALPGTVVGETTSNDAVLVATVLDSPPAGVERDGEYLAVSARTPYNRMLVPAMSLEATLTRDGSAVFSGELVRTLDPDLSYHYGAVVDGVESGDELALSPTVWPQTARHEGYETAFGGLLGGMPETRIDVSGL
ncbi:iron transporter [Candidatus Halobonum tyrrellensis]|uniref:DUF7350 domain-containing protein n=1 Tax=Candidatus Halobonum tyrrellensis G22 TaxID=1324957 RepID=V4IXZ9_9EURY|nr:iron transporter [Candidatus Halobonum tyrrellensis]ESP88037.1 hypothetical protein K933_10814 [Candidatus Halobonum tyrrellensis G22]